MPNEVTEAAFTEGWMEGYYTGRAGGKADPKPDWLASDAKKAMRAADTPPVEEVEYVCANCKGAIGELPEGRDPEEFCDTCYRDSQEALTPPVANTLTEGQLLSDKGEVERLREAAQFVLDQRASTYRARNGRDVGIQDESGEKVWLVPFDAMADLERALAALRPHDEAVVEGGEA